MKNIMDLFGSRYLLTVEMFDYPYTKGLVDNLDIKYRVEIVGPKWDFMEIKLKCCADKINWITDDLLSKGVSYTCKDLGR